ncbi:DUF3140 domain-containing protein [Pseudomonas argentinensis]|uniref:Uncharacterized protein n=1 Tax=Phytopseudomonas argentinensis TaxID=289370 RepID=A0A1I3PVA3_9GAMM|nr:DUF3140 domain-containing protein [Pseudomonas argentinensis]KAB0546466.1 DUF3140 domain-containing protein [Pseudomonas argentinensis]SFJ25523.1 Protein of unknown function [Pseudomonas argentinensis]
MSELSEAQKKAIRSDFKAAVNMPPSRLRRWLQAADSKRVGMTKGGRKVESAGDGQSVGHQMGERILEIKGKRVAELETDDYQAMRKVIGYVHRHLKQRPDGEVKDSRWRQSLMNWGHDPLKA